VSAAVERDAVVAAEVRLVAVPLERPITLRGTTIREREYVVLRLRTESGLEGAAIGYTRGTPLAEAVGEQLHGRVGGVRATSLVDVAQWDLAAKREGLPLWRLLGGANARVPILVVGGYFSDQRTLEDVAGELRARAEDGFRHLKVHDDDPERVERLREALPAEVELSVDLGMPWRELDAALPVCRRLDGVGLAFVEDPFPPELPDLTRALAHELETPVAAGEDAAGRDALVAVARAADVVRVDATSSGGIAAVLAAVDAAEGKPVMTHAFVELHGQVAGGVAAIAQTETIPYDTGANPVDVLLAETQQIEDGELVLSERPGNGLVFDWDAVARYTRSIHTHDLRRN
jgi:L-alanine-DL-glutamate epimerase-like enolase superfamily enzyme